jgi:hypothetical protein
MLQIKLNDTQRAELQQLARQAVGRVSERAHFVLLSDQGCSSPEIAQLTGYDTATVRTWLRAYAKRDIAGPEDVSIFARHGSAGFRPRWSTRKDDGRETPAIETVDGTGRSGWV